MIRLYSKKLLSPFVGLIQIAELPSARALSLDGGNWAIQYSLAGVERARAKPPATGLSDNYSLVASIEHGVLKRHPLHPFLAPKAVRLVTDRLFETVTANPTPFTAADCYEYWLLDSTDQRPLALLHSSIDEKDMAESRSRPQWIAMPAAQLEVPAPAPAQDGYVPPVNYRLQKLVEERAGPKPCAVWFERPSPATDGFPPCLIREDWDNDEQHQLCERYIRRLAPRLLMMHGLSQSVRHRLEQSAREYVFEVERFFPLYPEVIDHGSLTAARVEARMRRAAQG